MTGPNGREEPTPQHRAVAPLVGAYADEELAAEARAEVEAHLLKCDDCRRELRTQLAVRTRLMAERESHLLVPSHAISTRLREPGFMGSGRADRERVGALRQLVFHPPPLISWSGWLVATGLGAVLLFGPQRVASTGMGMTMPAPTVPTAVDSQPGPLTEAALSDFRRLVDSELPRGSNLAALKAETPFSVPNLRAPHMRLIAAWTTQLDSEPAVVLAYRCHNRLVVQYVVSEGAFFRHPRLREAIGSGLLYAAGSGKVNAIAWPDLNSASFLVGEFTPTELAAMRS